MAPLLPVAVITPYIAAALATLLYRSLGRRLGWAVAVVPITLFAYFASFLGEVGVDTVAHVWRWIPALGIDLSFALDGLGLLFSLLITGIGLLVIIYSIAYMGPREDLGKFYAYLLLFMGAMLGVVLSDNLLVLYFSWELTSVSSFLLIGFWHTRSESRDGALKSLLVTVMGGFALFAAILLIYVTTGTFEYRELIGAGLTESPFYAVIVALVLLGAFTKSAQAPFHFWLPSAMAAPTPVSAYLHSATMVKAGIFLVAKFSLILGPSDLWYYTVAAFGAVTMFLGALLALRQTDLKALLAFSTVSQLGFIMPLFAMGTPIGSFAGSAHVLSHAMFKGALFMLVGIIDHAIHTRDIRQLAGLRRRMPVTAALMGIAALSMAGVWPLSGFVSKELIFEAMLHPPSGANFWTGTFLALTVLGSVCTTAYSLILAHGIFFGALPKPASGKSDVDLSHAHDGPWTIMLGPAALVSLVILFGVVPGLFEAPILQAAAGASLGTAVGLHAHNMPTPGVPLYLSLVAIGLGALLYIGRSKVKSALDAATPPISSNRVYDGALTFVSRTAERLVAAQMTGFLRDYVVYIFGALILGLTAIAAFAAFPLRLAFDFGPVSLWDAVVLSLTAVGAIVVAVSGRRLAAVVALGLVGAMMALFFVLMGAPDLALTQLMVEAVSTVLILLAFARLPALRRERIGKTHNAVNLTIAVGSGLIVTAVAILGHGSRYFQSISSYYTEHSVDLGGGHNIVNVILVDFRGFDTMGEITVLAIAALSVKALISLRPKGPKREAAAEAETQHREGDA